MPDRWPNPGQDHPILIPECKPLRRGSLAVAFLAALAGVAVAATSALADGYSADEARQRMVLPEGFKAEVFASEPMIRQPVAACFDERGRLWVIEYLQYPTPAGLKPVTVDQYLRTEYDRVPDPPPKGPRGADRIKILEDTDGDGHADKVTTFLEGLNLASAIAVGHGGVFVGQAPYLLFYPDKDQDDRPDRDPDVLLSGFGMQDAHATVNSMMWGPDGWLYGAQGSTVTARIRGVEFQQGIWRYEPRSDRFELFAEGGGNTWGLDFDRLGHAFGSSNGGFVTFHMVQGGYYWKGFAKHGPLHNPHTFGYFNCVDYQGRKLGGHVTPGGILYKGDSFPASFQGAFIGGNLLANAVYWHALERKGSTFSAHHGGTLINARDTWFRPVDLLTGPEGSVFVVDWYDRRASHLDPRDNWDRSNGRIYKVSYEGTKTVKPFDLAKLSSAELVDLRSKANDWWPDMARRLLAERRDGSVIPALKALLHDDRDEPMAMRDLWALDVSGGLDDATALGLLEHPLPSVRRWAVRRLGDDARMNDSIRSSLAHLAGHDSDSAVRSQLASSCQRWAGKDALAILEPLLERTEDTADPHIPLLLWWAIEKQMRAGADADAVIALLTRPEVQQAPIVRDVVLERVARVLAERADEPSFEKCARLLTEASGRAQVDRLVAGMEKGLEGRRLEAVPTALVEPLEKLWDRPDPSSALILLAARLGSAPALARAQSVVTDRHVPEADRLVVVDLLGQVGTAGSFEVLKGLLDKKEETPAMTLAALNALGRFRQPEVALALIHRYSSLTPPLRDRVLDLLCSRKEWAWRLLDALADKTIATKDLRSAHVLQIVQLKDESLIKQVEVVWGRVPTANAPERAKRIAEVRGMLVEEDKGNAERGRLVFQQACAGCHKLFGEGADIGPDLTGAERGNLDFLLSSLVDPSSLIRKEYQAQAIATNDGRVLNGLVVEETDTTVTLFDNKQQKIVIVRDTIEQRKPSDTSLMPEGVLDPLREEQVRDLFRYLQSSGPRSR
ncbi:MAG TPA: PVC-type heme-binding CxxCH protein [Isosphaeraceae bacterium]|jgi:putative membrane-bound dehydrogenase-like protein|nr:PVC-type heme-binding CxxCH protein [Isosphaeraceae bacterium]